MRASVRHFISADVDLDDFRPSDPEDFAFLIQALIGPSDGEGEESLQFVVCTPRNMERQVEREGGITWGRGLVIVNSPKMPKILDFLKRSIERPERNSWSELAAYLGKFGVIEFED
ncbi:immunity 8 family protein [Streptomyces sp. NBC_01476]|uniref:Imm8 family immunity protein n=1 Tax=Streptomyces sp. NBC_01476 TaxID=2903881 RepID=UPI002E364081|nr:Imm8 family immunity protein [Streptomyces sp. NBC_01476]